ncbi:MAG: GNAT family N-acetyltransferase [Erysipelotrichaceae bacterium]|nr:GNAT family N-acetyltransferase [Erysipelotrichaceae bacterium]
MNIKELPKEDFEQAKQLYCESFNKPYQPTTIELLGKIIGIYQENQLIGIAQIDYINNVFENKRIAYINSFCIKKEYHHQGYGDKLLKECIQIIKKNQGNLINMTSNKNRVYAHMLYEKNNFETIDTILLKKEIQ